MTGRPDRRKVSVRLRVGEINALLVALEIPPRYGPYEAPDLSGLTGNTKTAALQLLEARRRLLTIAAEDAARRHGLERTVIDG